MVAFRAIPDGSPHERHGDRAGHHSAVISIETSRSDMEVLKVFGDFEYPNEIGPGVWDIHSPRAPSQAEMEALLRKAVAAIPVDRLWGNPDCGLKTRGWPEVETALRNLVGAARALREERRTAA